MRPPAGSEGVRGRNCSRSEQFAYDEGVSSETLLAIAAVAIPTLAVAFTAWLNHRAHEGITRRIDGVETRIDGVDNRAERRDEALRTAVESIARDVSFMAGRQAERDRGRPTGPDV